VERITGNRTRPDVFSLGRLFPGVSGTGFLCRLVEGGPYRLTAKFGLGRFALLVRLGHRDTGGGGWYGVR